MPAGGTVFDQSYFPYLDGYPADFSGLSKEMGRILWAALVHSPWDHAGGPFMSPKTYQQFFKPRHKMLCGYVHKHTKMKTLGAVEEFA